MDIDVIFALQLYSIQLVDPEIFKVSQITHCPKLPALTLCNKDGRSCVNVVFIDKGRLWFVYGCIECQSTARGSLNTSKSAISSPKPKVPAPK